MVELTEVTLAPCWVGTIETVGQGLVWVPVCTCPRHAAEAHVSGLAALLDLDQVERPAWRLELRDVWHLHVWTPLATPPLREVPPCS